MSNNNAFLIYQDDNGISNVNVRFEGDDVWRISGWPHAMPGVKRFDGIERYACGG